MNITRIEILEFHHQFIHLKVFSRTNESWFFTVMYASPSLIRRRSLWAELYRLNLSITGPWLLGGDFNATLLDQDRRSCAHSKLGADREFFRWFEEMNLLDLGFEGPTFTWKRGSSEARLDRFVANEDWMNKFPNAKVFHMNQLKSDHRPILLRLNCCETREVRNRPFRFIASWVLHENFQDCQV